MLFNKKLKKKGAMLIPIIIIGSIIIALSSYIFHRKMLNLQYENNNNNYLLREKTDEKYREVLLTKLSLYLKSNDIEDYSSVDITYQNSYVKYDKQYKCFILTIPYVGRQFKEECYALEEKNGKDYFKYIKTTIIER